MKILVTGSDGQLGRCIKGLESNFPHFTFSYKNSSELDITDLDQVTNIFNKNNFNWCINCAAYTNVDKAEIETTEAFRTNQIGAKNIALVCSNFCAKLIHISTDFIFDGNSTKAYTELDLANPLNVYGLSKLSGENEIISTLKNHFIIRTSWLYSEYGSNFLKTMLKIAETKNEINVVSDQIGAPTYAKDLGNFVLNIIKKDSEEYGIYNYSNQAKISWYDFAVEIFKISKSSVNVTPIKTSSFPTLAKRPKYSVLDKTKVKHTFIISISHWKESLEIAIQNLNEQKLTNSH